MARLFDDAQSEYLQRSSAVISSTPITMACWVYPDAALEQAFMSLGGSDGYQVHLLQLHWTNDTILAGSSAGSFVYAESTSPMSMNTWQHICGVWATSNDRRVYLDGGNKGINANNTTPTVNETSIGAHTYGGGTSRIYTSGRICFATMWNVALTDAEVLALSSGISPLRIKRSNIVAFWPLIVDDKDYSGNGNDLTAYNTPSWADNAPFGPPFGFSVGLPYAVTAGGAVYNESITESLSLAGQGAPRALFNRPLMDNLSLEDVLSIIANMSIVWGHQTGVSERNIRAFSPNWTGTGTISGSGDAEKIELDSGQYLESEDWETGEGDFEIDRDKYGTGSGSVTIQYKTASTKAGLSGAGWQDYSTGFSSLGWIKLIGQ